MALAFGTTLGGVTGDYESTGGDDHGVGDIQNDISQSHDNLENHGQDGGHETQGGLDNSNFQHGLGGQQLGGLGGTLIYITLNKL